MAFRRITVGKEKSNRIWLTLLVISFFPCALLSGSMAFFVVPNQAFTPEQQEIVDMVAVSVAEHGDALGKVTLKFNDFVGEIIIKNGVLSFPQTSIPSMIMNFLLGTVALCAGVTVVLAILYGISQIIFRYEE